MQNIEGIVERYGPGLIGHGDHSFSILLVNQAAIFNFPSIRKVYCRVHGRSTEANAFLGELTAERDHVQFKIEVNSIKLGFVQFAAPGTFRNFTLEKRIGCPTTDREIKDITPRSEVLSYDEFEK